MPPLVCNRVRFGGGHWATGLGDGKDSGALCAGVVEFDVHGVTVGNLADSPIKMSAIDVNSSVDSMWKIARPSSRLRTGV